MNATTTTASKQIEIEAEEYLVESFFHPGSDGGPLPQVGGVVGMDSRCEKVQCLERYHYVELQPPQPSVFKEEHIRWAKLTKEGFEFIEKWDQENPKHPLQEPRWQRREREMKKSIEEEKTRREKEEKRKAKRRMVVHAGALTCAAVIITIPVYIYGLRATIGVVQLLFGLMITIIGLGANAQHCISDSPPVKEVGVLFRVYLAIVSLVGLALVYGAAHILGW